MDNLISWQKAPMVMPPSPNLPLDGIGLGSLASTCLVTYMRTGFVFVYLVLTLLLVSFAKNGRKSVSSPLSTSQFIFFGGGWKYFLLEALISD